jgi:hypothetical protein
MQPQRDVGKRDFVDRAFTLRGIGTVVTGTLTGGHPVAAKRSVQPQDFEARIRSIKVMALSWAVTGNADCDQPADIGIGSSANQIKRGDVITTVDLWKSAQSSLFSKNPPGFLRKDMAARRFKAGSRIPSGHRDSSENLST